MYIAHEEENRIQHHWLLRWLGNLNSTFLVKGRVILIVFVHRLSHN